MDWYWWVLLLVALAVASAFIEEREFRAQRRAQDDRARGGTGTAMLCDICGDPLPAAEARIVNPREMRRLARNGYGDVVPMLAALPAKERRPKFQFLADANDTDWALCRSCHDKAGRYMAGGGSGGLSQSEMDEVFEIGLKPFLDAAAEAEASGGGAAGKRVLVECPHCRMGHRLPKGESGQVVCARCGNSFHADARG